MKLSEIDATLREIRVTPVKTLGQNFLHDRNLARWIVEKAEITKDDYVVEIGPGLGALTEFILERGAQVLAIEKDARLANFLRQRFAKSRLEVRHEDALDFDVRALFAQRRVKCVGSLPYYVASQLLLKFIEWPSLISDVFVHVTEGDGAASHRSSKNEELRSDNDPGAGALRGNVSAHRVGNGFPSATRC